MISRSCHRVPLVRLRHSERERESMPPGASPLSLRTSFCPRPAASLQARGANHAPELAESRDHGGSRERIADRGPGKPCGAGTGAHRQCRRRTAAQFVRSRAVQAHATCRQHDHCRQCAAQQRGSQLRLGARPIGCVLAPLRHACRCRRRSRVDPSGRLAR